MKKGLEEKASRNTLKNKSAMMQSASRVSDAGSDFIKYKIDALKIAKDCNLDKEKIKNKFKKLSMEYLENLYEMAETAVAKEVKKNFIGSMDAFYDCQKSALKVSKEYLTQKEVLEKFDSIKEKYGVKI